MFDFGPYRDSISELCLSLRVETLAFFGSSVTADFSDESDFDVLVSFKGDDRLFARYFDLKEGLEFPAMGSRLGSRSYPQTSFQLEHS